MNLIEIRSLQKGYNQQIVLDITTLNIKTGKCYLLLGENGSGKTTLIKLILGLIKSNQGIIINKIDTIGYIPERFIFPDFMTIYHFLYNLCRLRGLSKECINTINQLLKAWNLDGNKHFMSLSKGMLQKVLIIQAIIHKPSIYLFDEPLNGLDHNAQKQFIQLVKTLRNEQKTIIITTHYQKLYQGVYDVKLYIEDGRIYEKSR